MCVLYQCGLRYQTPSAFPAHKHSWFFNITESSRDGKEYLRPQGHNDGLLRLVPLHHCRPAVPHLDELSLNNRPPPYTHFRLLYSPPSCPALFPRVLHPPRQKYFPQSMDLQHTGLIPVTAVSHIIHPSNIYIKEWLSTAGVRAESLLSLAAGSTVTAVPLPFFDVCCFPK